MSDLVKRLRGVWPVTSEDRELAADRLARLEKALRDSGDYIDKGRPQMAQNIIRNTIAALDTAPGGKDAQ